MAKYKVLKPIEHNQVLHVPQGTTKAVKVKSAGYGGEIPVDASGTIELDATAARACTAGQIAPPAPSSAEASSAKQIKR